MWHVEDDTEHVIAIQTSSGDSVAQTASLSDLIQDAIDFALSYVRDFRALHQFNHDHELTRTY